MQQRSVIDGASWQTHTGGLDRGSQENGCAGTRCHARHRRTWTLLKVQSSRKILSELMFKVVVLRDKNSYGESDQVTLMGHVRAGIGYRNEFRTQNYGPLTKQSLFPTECVLSHVWDV